jgi:hypothetical protein
MDEHDSGSPRARAVALGDVRQVGGDAKSNSPAIAAAFERSHALRLLSSVASSSALIGYLSKAAVIGLAHHQDREGLQHRLALRMK